MQNASGLIMASTSAIKWRWGLGSKKEKKFNESDYAKMDLGKNLTDLTQLLASYAMQELPKPYQ